MWKFAFQLKILHPVRVPMDEWKTTGEPPKEGFLFVFFHGAEEFGSYMSGTRSEEHKHTNTQQWGACRPHTRADVLRIGGAGRRTDGPVLFCSLCSSLGVCWSYARAHACVCVCTARA